MSRQDGLALEILRMSLMHPGKVKPAILKGAEEHLISVLTPVSKEMVQEEYEKWREKIET